MQYLRLFFLILFLFSPVMVWAMGRAPSASTREVAQDPLVGQAAADMVLSKTDGTTASLSSVRQGKKGILVFWATWCPHCYEELGAINSAWAQAQQKGIEIILVSVGERKADVNSYLNQRQINLVSFLDEDNALQEAYHLEGIPTLVFIDEKGMIRDITHAFPSDYENYFSAQ